MVHWPPLFPAVLAGLGASGLDPACGARWLNAFLFGGSILLVGLAVKRHTGGSLRIALFGSLLMLTSVDMLYVHAMALSEPLFVFFGLLGLLLLASHIEKPKQGMLVASAFAVALAFLARYVGVALVAAGGVGILAFSGEGRRKKMLDASIFGAVSCSPMALWILRNICAAGTGTNREMALHPVNYQHLKKLGQVVKHWIFADDFPRDLRTVLSAILVLACLEGLLLFFADRRRAARPEQTDRRSSRLPHLLGVFIFAYLAILTATISLFDRHTPITSRTMLPVYVALLVLTLCVGHRWLSRARRPVQYASAVVCAVLAVSYWLGSARWAGSTYAQGVGYASEKWLESRILAELVKLPPDVVIFSNAPDFVCYATGRRARMFPRKVHPAIARENEEYPSQLAAMRDYLASEGGVLVFFRHCHRRYLPSEEELKERLPLRLLTRTDDGAIYGIDPLSGR